VHKLLAQGEMLETLGEHRNELKPKIVRTPGSNMRASPPMWVACSSRDS
jgi:hypothetical protein